MALVQDKEIRCGEAVISLSDHRLVDVDEQMCTLFGYRREEIMESGDLSVLGSGCQECIIQIKDMIAKKGYAVCPCSVMTKSGKEVLVICHGTFFYNDQGRLYLRLVFTPMADEYKKQKGVHNDVLTGSARSDIQSMRFVLDAMTSSVYIVSKEHHKILYFNGAFLNLHPNCTEGQSCFASLYNRESPCENCVIRQIEGKGTNSGDIVFYNQEYKQSFNVSAISIEWDGEPAYLLCVRNIKQTPDELERKRKRERMMKNYARIFRDNCDVLTEIHIKTAKYTTISQDMDYPFAIPESGDYLHQEQVLMEYIAFPADKERIKETLGYENMLRAFENGATKLECRFRMFEDEKIRWKHVNVYYSPDEHDPMLILTTNDITDAMAEEEATFSDRRNILRAVSKIYFGIVYVDLTRERFHILKTDQEVPKLLMEGPLSEYMDKLCEQIHPADRKLFRDTFERRNLLDAIKEGKTDFYCEVRELVGAGYYRYVRIESIVLDEDTTDYVQLMLLFSDITKKRREEEETKSALETAESINGAKTKILTKMSQDVYDTVNDIFTSAGAYLDRKDYSREKMEYIHDVREKCKAIKESLGDILEIARMESHNMVISEDVFTMEELLDSVKRETRAYTEENGIEFTLLTKGLNGQRYQADVVHLRQILMQLLSNATKYSDAGGKVTLFIRQTAGDQAKDIFDIVVEDEGIGMEEAVVNKMHELFRKEQQADSRFVCGAGLSLTIVKNLVSLLGGTIRVRSARGQGTTFHINIELSKAGASALIAEETSHEQEMHLSSAEKLAGKRILLVEDNRLNQDMAMTLLELKDIRTECANHGKEAYDLFEMSDIGYYDLILMDAQMPFRNGFETAMALREMSREDAKTIPIIAMLESRADYEVAQVEQSGMNDYIVKPLESQELFGIIEKYS